MTASTSEPDDVLVAQPGLQRKLSFLDSTMINVGSMIGSGIFLVPAAVSQYLQSSWLVLVVWIVGGFFSLLGALSVAELGSLYPRAGGQYVYLSEAYGRLWGFLYGWTAFTVIMSASIAAVAVGFATYLGYFIPFSPVGIKMVAIASIAILTAINCFGVKAGALVQNTLTFIKMGTLGFLIVLGFFFHPGLSVSMPSPSFSLSAVAGPFALALVAVLWSYDGWIEITYVAGEVKNPQRNISRSVIASTLIVILIYVLTNFTYVSVLSMDAISKSKLVVADAASALVGPIGGTMAVIAVIVAMLGCNNGFVLTGARIYYAMASDRMFFRSLAKIHPRYHTPVPALAGQGVWAAVLVLTSAFNQLFTYVIFASWIFYALAAGAVIVLRKRSPKVSGTYKTWGYPFTPIVFILFALCLMVATIVEDPRDAAAGLGIILLGLPAYFYWRK